MISGLVSAVLGVVAAILGIVIGIIVPLVVCVIVPLAVLGVPLLMVMLVIWLLGLPSERRARRTAPDDSRIVQDVHRGLARMENRLSALETLMLDRGHRPLR